MNVDAMGNPIGAVTGAKTTALPDTLHILYNDLREWLSEVQKLGEVKIVKGASWEQDIGMATEVVMHDENAPCVVFEEIPGAIPGSRVLVNFFGAKRKNMTLGFPTHLTKLQLTDEFHKHYMAELSTVSYEVVKNGPVLENIMEGDDVDVTRFPVPLWHAEDGGRYIGTGSFNRFLHLARQARPHSP